MSIRRSLHADSGPCESDGNQLSGPELLRTTRAMVKGNEEAFNRFHKIYSGRLYRYLLVLGRGDEDQARENLQQTMLRVIRYIKSFSEEEVFWRWLVRIARTVIIDHIRRQDRRKESVLPEAIAMPRSDDRGDIMLGLLETALGELDEKERALVEGAYFEHTSHKELAVARDTTAKAIESKLARIRNTLRESILRRIRNEGP